MATAAKARRERPADGGIVWHERFNAFECWGCGKFEEIRKAANRTPDRLAEIRELLIADHTECWEYDDPRMGADARKYRKEKKRRELLKARAGGSGPRDQSPQRRGPVAGGPDQALETARMRA